jgi:LPXTG-motif cell wall-anchored protein
MARRIRSLGALAVVVLMLALVPAVGAAPQRQEANAVAVDNQPIVDGAITVASVTAAADGWIVAHLDEGGQAGTVLGQTAVKAGANTNVVIKLSKDVPVDGKLWPMLHIDAGTIGTYEFPGPDAPVKDSAGKVVMKQFTVTAAPTTTAPTTPAPSNLPPTGGAESILPALLAGALVLLAGGLVLRRRRA